MARGLKQRSSVEVRDEGARAWRLAATVLSTAVTAGALGGCGLAASVGGTLATAPTREPGSSFGVREEVTGQFRRDRGLLVGVVNENGWLLADSAEARVDRWRVGLLAGWGSPPLPYKRQLGWDLVGELGYGRFPAAGTTRLGIPLGLHTDLSYRFGRQRDLWDAEGILWLTPTFVLGLSAIEIFPTDRESSMRPWPELGMNLSVRLHFYSSVAP